MNQRVWRAIRHTLDCFAGVPPSLFRPGDYGVNDQDSPQNRSPASALRPAGAVSNLFATALAFHYLCGQTLNT